MRWTLFAAFPSLSASSSSVMGAGLVVVCSITSLAGDAGAHTGHEEPP